MRMILTLILSCLALTATHAADAVPTRDTLIEAWTEHVRALPGTTQLRRNDDGSFLFEDTDLPFTGELRIVAAIVRPADVAGLESDYSHVGMVEFELVGLPQTLKASQIYYYWMNDRQALYYSPTIDRWDDASTYQSSYMQDYDVPSLGILYFMLNYGVWILLIALLVFVFIAAAKQIAKTRTLMNDSSAINEKASENIDRAEAMQNEMMALARENRDLQLQSNATLEQILDALKR